MNSTTDWYALNGAFHKITSAEDSPFPDGLKQEDGLFETLSLIGNSLVHGQAHVDRMRRSAENLGYPTPEAFPEVLEDSQKLANKGGITDGVIRWSWIVHTPTSASLFLQSFPSPADLAERRNGTHGSSSDLQRTHAGYKTLRYEGVAEAQQLATQRVSFPGEAIFCTGEDEILEGARSNIFVRVGDTFSTPKADGRILPGVTRQHFLAYLQSNKCRTEERRVTREELYQADSVYLTGSLVGLTTLLSLDGKRLGTEPCEIVERFWQEQTGSS